MPRSIGRKKIDFTKHWSILDQTKEEFRKAGRFGIVIVVGHTDEDRQKLTYFLAKLGAESDMDRQHIIIENKKYAKELFQLARQDGLTVELIAPSE